MRPERSMLMVSRSSGEGGEQGGSRSVHEGAQINRWRFAELSPARRAPYVQANPVPSNSSVGFVLWDVGPREGLEPRSPNRTH